MAGSFRRLVRNLRRRDESAERKNLPAIGSRWSIGWRDGAVGVVESLPYGTIVELRMCKSDQVISICAKDWEASVADGSLEEA